MNHIMCDEFRPAAVLCSAVHVSVSCVHVHMHVGCVHVHHPNGLSARGSGETLHQVA